jgi:hexosaminidase
VRALAVAVLCSSLVPAVAGAAVNPRPFTIPALRAWHGGQGTFALPAHPRVFAIPAARREAAKLAKDLGGRVVKRGLADIHMGLAARRGLGAEGYELEIHRPSSSVTISARRSAGWFYGGRTVLALRDELPVGRAIDRPAYRERGMSIDVGRRFYPRAWLIERIEEFGRLKLNLLHLHLSDDQGFRVASRSHPEIVSEEHLTAADVRALQAAAKRHHVTIVPEIDMPGHMTAALAEHPELQLADALGNRQADKLDVTLPAARQFAAEVIADQLKLWKGPYWHGGADEYLGAFSTEADYARYPQLQAYAREKHGPEANGHDAVQDFTNTVGEQVRAAGRRLRVWSDGMGGAGQVKLLPGAIVEWWENRVSPTPQELVAAGHDVLNVGWWPLYYVNGGPFSSLRSTEADFYEQWDPWHFEGPYTTRWTGGPPQFEELPRDDKHLRGATIAVWNDDPANAGGEPTALAKGLTPRLRILAQKTWGSKPLATTYADFASAASSGPSW